MKNLKKVMGMALILALSACTAAPKNGLPDTSKTSSPQTEVREETTDVVVIGAGGAGLTAAYFVKQGGKDVVLLEKRAMTGGNTALAGFFAANSTKMQEAMGDTYTQQDQIDFLMETEGTDPDFARWFADNSGLTAELAVDTLGIEVTRVNGREIYAVDEKGTKFPAQFVSKLTALNQQIGVDLRTECPAVSLIIEDGKITGVEAEDAQGKVLFHAQAVILASGGFAANQEMLQEYVPEWAGGMTSNTAATTGDGVRMAQAIGAAVSNMDQLTLNPTFYDDQGTTMSVSGVRYEGGILVDPTGKRFANEMANYTEVSEAEKAIGSHAFAIMDATSLACNPKYAVEAESIEELAEKIGVDPATLTQTVTNYQRYYDNQKDEEFGRTDMRSRIDTAPFYAVPVFPGVHHTRGGVSIDLRSQVLNTEGNPIPGLYGAGEVTDNKLMGNDPVAAGITFGRLCAQSVLEDLQQK